MTGLHLLVARAPELKGTDLRGALSVFLKTDLEGLARQAWPWQPSCLYFLPHSVNAARSTSCVCLSLP